MELYFIIKVIRCFDDRSQNLRDDICAMQVPQVQNIDFDHQYERSRDLPRIAGMILDFSVIKKGSEIGFFSGKNENTTTNYDVDRNFSGKPVKLRDRDNGRGAENHLLQDSLSQKLWKQVDQFLNPDL